MKRFISVLAQVIILTLVLGLSNFEPVLAQEPDPLSWQQSSIGMKRSQWGYVAGLGPIVETDRSWPMLSLRGGVANAGWRNILGPIGIEIGSITVPGYSTATLSNEVTDWAYNELTFTYGAASPLKVWVTRTSPAILIQTQANTLQLLSGDVAGNEFFTNDYGETEVRDTSRPSYPKYVAFPTSSGITVQALNTAGTSLSSLNSNWLLVWYGNNSHFLETKTPLSYTGSGWDASSLPVQEAYRADAPLLMVFQNQPNSIKHTNQGGIDLSFAGESGYVSLLPLLGRDNPNVTQTEGWAGGLPGSIAQKAQWWAAHLCSYPVSASETYAYNRGSDTTTITENISFLNVCSGGTSFAPIPPMLGLVKDTLGVTFSGAVVNANLLTEFGPILGIENTTQYSWSVTGLRNYTNVKRQLEGNQVPAELTQALEAETQKMIAKGHFAPWIFMDKAPMNLNRGDLYWANPADVLYHLVEIADTLPAGSLKNNFINYIKSERSTYPPEDVFNLNLTTGTIRGPFSYYGIDTFWSWNKDATAEDTRQDVFLKNVPLYSFYALARYYDLVQEALPANFWPKAKTALSRDMHEQDWATFYWFYGYQDRRIAVVNANRHFAGLVGYVKLAAQAGDQPAEDLGRALLAKAAVLRLGMAQYPRYLYSANLVKLPAQPNWQPRYTAGHWRGYIFNYNWTGPYDDARQVAILDQHEVYLYDHSGYMKEENTKDFTQLTSAHLTGYRDMVPELARFLAQYAKADAEIYAKKVEAYFPHWYAAFAENTLGMEHGLSHPIDSFQIFMAKALIQQETPDKLSKYADISWLEAGDLFYVHKLAEAIKAYRGYIWQNQ